ncbi:MAG: hypothetical protein IJM21_10480 [Clostridia bacterium]|nr:hypothetical protein [Clostridia bacterium]
MSEKTKLLINADDSHWFRFWNELARENRFDEDSLNQYVMQYASSGVTDLLFNIFGQSSNTPTGVLTFRGALYGQTEQHGNPVDYGDYYGLAEFYLKHGVDIFAVWIEKCREIGVRPWISLRMNDCHHPDEAAHQIRGELFYEAEKNGWTIGESYGYFRHCVDYAVPQIRETMLAYLREQLFRYDVYGIELDFMREITCFDYWHEDRGEIVGMMNDFMRKAARIVREAGERHGHKICMNVRMMRDLDQCRIFGFDILTWCRESLIDSITVTPRWATNDSAMPLDDWKLRCPEAEIYMGLETLINTQRKGCVASAAAARGYGAAYLSGGADGLYLFNYMSDGIEYLREGRIGEREREVYDTCSSLEEILKYPRRFVVTYQDTVPKGWKAYEPLPVTAEREKPAKLRLEVGRIPSGASVDVLLGLARALPEDNALCLTVDGKDCAFCGRDEVWGRSEADGSDVPQGYCREDTVIYRYRAEGPADPEGRLTLEFRSGSETLKITYCEIDVTPA